MSARKSRIQQLREDKGFTEEQAIVRACDEQNDGNQQNNTGFTDKKVEQIRREIQHK